MKRIISLWLPVALWCGVIFFLSGLPDLKSGLEPAWDLVLRKIAHAAEYAALAGFFWRALAGSGHFSVEGLFRWTLAFCVAYAASDEWHQSFVPGRHASALDVAVDGLGALAAGLFQRRWRMDLVSYMKVRRAGLWLLAGLCLAPCARMEFSAAQEEEREGRYEQALKAYMALADARPGHSLAPQALLQAGRLASGVLRDHALARDLFLKVLDRYGDKEKWGERAEKALFNTPNYFPLVPDAKWEEGDSETGGRNARVKIICRPQERDPSRLALVRSYYAGDQFIKELSAALLYRKEDLELREYRSSKDDHTVILKYPFTAGSRWTSKRQGREIAFAIEGTATVKVRAGVFADCLKVREQVKGTEGSWKVDYYAPGVGKVLTALATPDGERRNTELLSYDLPGREEP